MAEMFGLLKELIASRNLKKVLVREEARNPITKHVNSISLIRMKEEKSVGNNKMVGKMEYEAYHSLPVDTMRKAMLKKMITKKEDTRITLLTEEKLVEIETRLSLASQSYIYPLGIAEDVLVEIADFIYPVDFVILDIKEDRKRPFILGMPFLTTAKAEIRIKFHQEKELKFNQWRGKMFNDKDSATTREDVIFADEGGVT
ncbi:MAK10-like protein, partial [Tanacetum coccineum]